MRGKPASFRPKYWLLGITPAYAGKTINTAQKFIVTQDHPRVCGENFIVQGNDFNTRGSPPRMRGKLTHTDHARFSIGITPAYAGKTMLPLRLL